MARQWIEIAEQVVRGTVAADEVWFPLPVRGSLKPKFVPVDEARKEFRGADTGQGDSTLRRKESQWTYALECYLYPIAALGLLLKHAMGIAGSRAVVDTSAYAGLFLYENLPFGTGAELADKALMIRVNYDNGEGTTVSKIYHGARLTKFGLSGEGTDDVVATFELAGPGEYITAEGVATAAPDFSTLPSPFNSSDALLYIGSGATRTGTAPNYTAIVKGTAPQFIPDSFKIDVELGRADKVAMNGVRGPSVTTKAAQLAVSGSFPIDVRDPSSGFSSHDEIEALFSAPRELPILLVLDSGEVAGAATETYKFILDLPRMARKPDSEEYNTEGKIPSNTFEMFSLYSDTTKYALAILTTDQNDAYPPTP